MDNNRLDLSINSINSEEDFEAILLEHFLKQENHISPESSQTLEDTICISLSEYQQTRDPYASYDFEIIYSHGQHKFIVTTTRNPQEFGSASTFENEFSDCDGVAGYIASYSIIEWFNNKVSPDQLQFLDAIKNNRLQEIKALLKKGVNINQRDINGNPYLITAVRICDSQTIEVLLNFNPDLEMSDNFNNTPLHWSIIEYKYDIFWLLIQHGADITAINSSGDNGLMTAAAFNNIEAMSFFLKHGFDVTLKNKEGRDALAMAISMGNDNAARLLMENGAVFKSDDLQKHFVKSSELGYTEITEFLLDNGAAIDAPAPTDPEIEFSDKTALMNAAALGHNKIIKLLIKNGAEIDRRDSAGKTALMYAAEGNHAKSIKLLLDAGASIESTDKDGKTPVYLALECASTTSAGYLIKRGARIDSIKDPGEVIKDCINLMEERKETLEDLIRFELESPD